MWYNSIINGGVNMGNKKAQDVFIPGALPESTYITRQTKTGFTYEERLKQALNMSGYLTSISGQSKIGKTVLCEKVVGLDHLIEVSGSDFTEKDDLWRIIGTKAGMPSTAEMINSGNIGTSMKESYLITKENVIEYYKSHELVLLLDDFHYADNTMQIFMAQQFKDAIRKGFKVIIVSLPHRSDDAIRTNADLQGRINIIDIEMWTKDELMEIPRAGFHDLGIEISEKIIGELAKESLCSPHLMQLICLNICLLQKTDEINVKEIQYDILDRAFKFSTLNFNYQQIADTIKQGKNSRGKSRKTYKTSKNSNLDLYELILEAISVNPPLTNLTFEDLMARISSLVTDEEKPTPKSLKEYLKNLQEVLDLKDRSYRVIEWKDDTLFILEPLFLFFLRWGRY